jgi:hypothetical protein
MSLIYAKWFVVGQLTSLVQVVHNHTHEIMKHAEVPLLTCGTFTRIYFHQVSAVIAESLYDVIYFFKADSMVQATFLRQCPSDCFMLDSIIPVLNRGVW